MFYRREKNIKGVFPKIYTAIVFFSLIFFSEYNYPMDFELPKIAKWYNNLEYAVSLRFDDNLDSHVEYVIPVLNKFSFKATFMINPGRNYKKYKDFWENDLPQMGHKLGNHTWHHHGAETHEEAEYEIGEVSRLIWKLYPDESKLHVFASGGGEKWGGERWHRALPQFKEIPKRYHLLDLYDGNHPAVTLDSDCTQQDIEKLIYKAIAEKKHQAFMFHKIGSKNLIDFLRKIITDYNYTFGEEQFLELIEYLNSKRDQIWIAPLIQILKYETELKSSELIVVKMNKNSITMRLNIGTDTNLYDQELSLIIPSIDSKPPTKVFQDHKLIGTIQNSKNEYICNIRPAGSKLVINYD